MAGVLVCAGLIVSRKIYSLFKMFSRDEPQRAVQIAANRGGRRPTTAFDFSGEFAMEFARGARRSASVRGPGRPGAPQRTR